MYVSSRFATWQVVAIVLLITLAGFGVPGLKAEGHGCQHQSTCPAPVLEKPTPPPEPMCCPAPVVQKPTPAEPTCCPVDPKEVRKAEKAAEHAQHEAAEACKRQHAAAEKAQRRIDEAAARGNHEVEEATAKVQQRNSEWVEQQAKLNSLTATEATAQTESGTMRAKPEPTPEVVTPECGSGCYHK